MRHGDVDRRTMLKRTGALAVGAWTLPALTTMNVAEAVGSPAPGGGAGGPSVVSSRLLVTGGTTTIVWKDAGGLPAGPVPREYTPAMFLGAPPATGDVPILSADPLGTVAPSWTGELVGTIFTGQIASPGRPVTLPTARWPTTAVPYVVLRSGPSSGVDFATWPVSDTVSWSDIWLVITRP